jgi:hypothetical protein
MRRLHVSLVCLASLLFAAAPAGAYNTEIQPELVAMAGWAWPV